MQDYGEFLRSRGWVSVRPGYLFKGCPKADGWFGMYARLDGNDVKVTGHMRKDDREVSSRLRHGEPVLVHVDHAGFSGAQVSELTVLETEPDYTEGEALRRLGSIKGVGKKTAEACVRAFGRFACIVVRRFPEEMARAGIPAGKRTKLLSGMMADLPVEGRLRLLCPAGILSDGQIRELSEEYDDKAVEILTTDPYRILKDFPESLRFSFDRVDRIGRYLGAGLDDPARLSACLAVCIRGLGPFMAGNVCVDLCAPVDGECFDWMGVLQEAFVSRSGVALDRTKLYEMMMSGDGCDVLEDVEDLGEGEGDDHMWLYPEGLLSAEKRAASGILRLSGQPSLFEGRKTEIADGIRAFERANGAALDAEQKEAVFRSLMGRVSAITGIPGSGKTSVAKCILKIFLSGVSGGTAVLCAPTGLATKRLVEVCTAGGLFGARIVHGTIAKLCACVDSMGEQAHPDGAQLVVVDESTMADLSCAASLLSIYRRSHIVFLGDADQLPSIGPGQFFQDLVRSRAVPVSRLVVCHRSGGARELMDAFACIRRGERTLDPGSAWGRVFSGSEGRVRGFFTRDMWESADMAVRAWRACVSHSMTGGGRVSDVAVLCPMNKGPCGSVALNLRIRDLANPHAGDIGSGTGSFAVPGMEIPGMYCYPKGTEGTGGERFRVGDRAMFTKNLIKKYNLVNGDTGTIRAYVRDDDGSDRIVFGRDGSHVGTVAIERADFEYLRPAYALTVHKSQGCEYRYVICLVPHGFAQMGNFACRNIVYTAATRAKDYLCFAGSAPDLDGAVGRLLPGRTSQFAARLSWSELFEKFEEGGGEG